MGQRAVLRIRMWRNFVMGNSLRITTLASAIGIALIGANASLPVRAASADVAKSVAHVPATTRELYIVRFTEPGLLHYSGGTQGLQATAPAATHQRKLDARSPAATAYSNYLQTQRGAHLQAITQAIGRNLDVTHSYLVTMNGVAAEMSIDEASKVAKLPGIESVKRSRIEHLDTYRGPTFIGADKIWDGTSVPGGTGTRGQGVVVGVIDSGANSDHPSFADDATCGFNAGNPKLISAVDCSQTNGGGACVGPNPEANDGNGHGVHTASTAVGNTLDSTAVPPPVIPAPFTTISGVASCSSLRTYKVCPTTQCTTAAINAAIENAIIDQVDVINFSISGGSDPWNDTDRLFLDAVGADVFVAASAGNTRAETPNPVGEVNHLGPWVTTVAASTHNLNVSGAGLLNVTGPGTPPPEVQNISLNPGSGTNAGTDLTGVEIRHYAANEIGCTANGAFPPDYFAGAIALIQRGTCTFEEKINNAEAAGAVVAIISNNVAGVINMSVGAADLPAYSILQAEGADLVEFIDASGGGPVDRIFADGFDGAPAGGAAVGDFTPAVQQGDVLAGFSLRGPSALTSVTKPDITGPGVSIYAALDDATTGGYGFLSGTSMSSPHLAGAGALVRAVHADWTPAEVKSALMLTAFTNGNQEDGTTPWTPDDVGSGRADLTKAALAGFVMDETFANFLAAEPPGGDPKTLNIPSARNMNCVDSCDWTRTLRNTLTTPSNWTVTVNEPAGLDVSVDTTSFAFTGGIAETQDITITASPTAALTEVTYAEVVFHETNGAAPDAHIYVAVKGSGSGGGDIIVSGPINLDVPNNGGGIYINWVSGESDTAPVTGWDFNPYSNGALVFYWGGDVSEDNAGVASDGVLYDVLGSGDSIGPSSTFIQNAQSGSDNWLVGVDGYLGFKFLNEDTGEINFGYAHITSTSPTGFPAVIVDYAYDQSGAEITIP
jgi:subtilisin family serine protease